MADHVSNASGDEGLNPPIPMLGTWLAEDSVVFPDLEKF